MPKRVEVDISVMKVRSTLCQSTLRAGRRRISNFETETKNVVGKDDVAKFTAISGKY